MKPNIEHFLQEKRGSIIDVRTAKEFNYGHIPHSINIPLVELESQLTYLQTLPQPLLLCCAKGVRSETAQEYLSQFDLECYNVGSWLEVQTYLSKNP